MHAFVYSYAGMHASVYTNAHTCLYMRAYAHAQVRVRVSMYVRIHACIHIWSRPHDCTCAWARCYAPHARRRAPPLDAALRVAPQPRPWCQRARGLGGGRAARLVFLSPSSLSPLSSSTSLRTPCPWSKSWTPIVPEEAFGPLDFFSMIPTGRS